MSGSFSLRGVEGKRIIKQRLLKMEMRSNVPECSISPVFPSQPVLSTCARVEVNTIDLYIQYIRAPSSLPLHIHWFPRLCLSPSLSLCIIFLDLFGKAISVKKLSDWKVRHQNKSGHAFPAMEKQPRPVYHGDT